MNIYKKLSIIGTLTNIAYFIMVILWGIALYLVILCIIK